MEPEFIAKGLRAPNASSLGADAVKADLDAPKPLIVVLTELQNEAKNNPLFAAIPHYIYVEIGDSKSLIKADLSEVPHQFWVSNLKGRPALAERPLLTEFGQCHDLYLIKEKERLAKIEATKTGENIVPPLPANPLQYAFQELAKQKRVILPDVPYAKTTKSWPTFFKQAEKELASVPHQENAPGSKKVPTR